MMVGQKHTYVCFHCRASARCEWLASNPLCQHYNRQMTQLHNGIRIPRRKDAKGWDRLWLSLIERQRKERVRWYYGSDSFKRWKVEKLRGRPI